MLNRLAAPAFTAAALFVPLLRAAAHAQTAPPPSATTPAPTPTPTQSAPPAIVVGGIASTFTSTTSGVNATGSLASANGVDATTRTDVSNFLITATKPSGVLRYSIIAGEYAFPTVGQALNATLQKSANTNLYSALPVAYLAYVPNTIWNISVGKLPTLLGQENGFTYQNVDIQRGLGWAIEPTISRGIRATYATGKFTANIEYSDGYYSGWHRAVEGSAGWQLDPSTSATLAFILPQADTPANTTASIANKSEYDLMISKQYGKLQLLPYILYVYSPASGAAGYTSDERALVASLIANYTFNDRFSLATRVEHAADFSLPGDTSANADLVGYGPGSAARTYTITPQYKYGHFFARAEYSHVVLGSFAPAFGFGATGMGASQSRELFEIGAQY